jgi:hypothetical protein
MLLQHRRRSRFVARVQSELRVVTAGANVCVRVRIHSDVEAKHDLRTTSAPGERRKPLEFFEAINDDATGAAGNGGFQLGARFTGAVQRNAIRREAGVLGERELAKRADVDTDGRLRKPS